METAVSQDRWSVAKHFCVKALGTLWDERWAAAVAVRSQQGCVWQRGHSHALSPATVSTSPADGTEQEHTLGVPVPGLTPALRRCSGESRWAGRCSELPVLGRCPGQLRVLCKWRPWPVTFSAALPNTTVWRARPLHHGSPNPIFCRYVHRKSKGYWICWVKLIPWPWKTYISFDEKNTGSGGPLMWNKKPRKN